VFQNLSNEDLALHFCYQNIQ